MARRSTNSAWTRRGTGEATTVTLIDATRPPARVVRELDTCETERMTRSPART